MTKCFQFKSVVTIIAPSNEHTVESTVSTKPKHYTLHGGRMYSRTVVFDI